MDSLVSWLIFLPIILGAATWLVKFKDDDAYRGYGLAASAGIFVLSTFLLSGDYSTGEFAFMNYAEWIPRFGISYFVAVDGISVYLVLLTTLVFPIAFLAMGTEIKKNVREFVGLLLLLEGGILGVFMSIDLVLFYIFWEVMLIPSYFLIAIWAEKDNFYTAIKFVAYTLVGSLLFLAAIVIIGILYYKQSGDMTFNLMILKGIELDTGMQYFLFGCFALAFCIKAPLFPLHSWMPHAYIKSSTAMVIVLTGVMSKTGLYGLMRFNFNLFPEVSVAMSGLILVLAMVGIIYGAWCAIGQDDIKGIAAYSSLSHLNFVVLGMFAFNTIGESSAVLQMFNHGIVSAGIFFFIGLIQQRTGERNLSAIKMLSTNAPLFSGIFFVIVLAALGLPGLNNFVGEFLLLIGLWTTTAINFASTIVFVSVVAIIFASIYMLYMYQGAMHEKPEGTVRDIIELRGKELAAVVPIALLTIYIGLHPASITNNVNASADKLAATVQSFLPSK